MSTIMQITLGASPANMRLRKVTSESLRNGHCVLSLSMIPSMLLFTDSCNLLMFSGFLSMFSDSSILRVM